MASGRLLVALGLCASAGLAAVRESQEQVALGYTLAKAEGRLFKIREGLAVERARLESLRAPARIVERAAGLGLNLAPRSPLPLFSPHAAAGGGADASSPPRRAPALALSLQPCGERGR